MIVCRVNRGFTLVETVVALVVMAVLITVSLQSLIPISNSAKIEDTRTELDELAHAIAGNPDLTSNGERSDFGYVGDVGALPVSLDHLVTNPGSYSTWNGPYLQNDFSSWTTDITTDAWNTTYTYTPDSARIASTGSGSSIIRQIVANKSALVINKVVGSVVDNNGTPPGAVYKDSVSIRLTIPDGIGSTTTKIRATDLGGYFAFDSIPIGRHKLEVIYTVANDSLTRYVVVLPATQTTTAIRLTSDHWNASTP
jgi:prepilin-type N-terminal cleavage/methylation domain-containing protein